MNIGDRVRMLHSSEEGIITKVLDNNIIEVEIEDGFHIPIKKTEVVVVSQEEDRQFGRYKANKSEQNQSEKNSTPAVVANKGIYTVFIPINDKLYAFYLVNNTDFDLPYLSQKRTANV